jgi:hypothetical protein
LPDVFGMSEREVVESGLEHRELVCQCFGMVGTESLAMASILVSADGRVGESTQADSAAIGRHLGDGGGVALASSVVV